MIDYFQEMHRFNHKAHAAMQLLAKQEGVEFLGGPQGRVLRYLHHHEEGDVFIKDIEQELKISKSVASNLIKRMVKNGFVEIEQSETDKRSKRIVLSDLAKRQVEKIPPFIEEFHQRILEGISNDDLEIFFKVLTALNKNVEKIETKGEKNV